MVRLKRQSLTAFPSHSSPCLRDHACGWQGHFFVHSEPQYLLSNCFLFFLQFIGKRRTNMDASLGTQIRRKEKYFCCMNSERTTVRSVHIEIFAHSPCLQICLGVLFQTCNDVSRFSALSIAEGKVKYNVCETVHRFWGGHRNVLTDRFVQVPMCPRTDHC